jgi:hypothetical protein
MNREKLYPVETGLIQSLQCMDFTNDLELLYKSKSNLCTSVICIAEAIYKLLSAPKLRH